MRELLYTFRTPLLRILLSFGLFGPLSVHSQIVLNSDIGWPYPAVNQGSSEVYRNSTPDTLMISASNPFFDDFAYEGLSPDTNKWFVSPSLIDVPTVTRHLAVDPPSRGVVSFDGNDRFGTPYNPANLASGTADRLFSHYIDLSGFVPSSQLYLSFFLQPQGNGERPENTDSFFVYFRTPNAPPQEFQKVYATGGKSVRPFEQVVIPVLDPIYHHAGFQLLFESLGSQNGSLDEWHLDYVFLAPNRSFSDTIYQDQALIGVTQSPLSPYTAISIQQYQGMMNPMVEAGITVNNLDQNGNTVTLTSTLSDPVAQTPLTTPFSQQLSIPMTGFASSTKLLSTFADQPLSEISALKMDVSISSPGDQQLGNNQFSETYRIDSVLAYDDGERDAGFGLNQSLGFATQFNLPQIDSISAVWISFQPTINYNPISGTVTYMNDQPFRLVVWNKPHPDSTILVQSAGMKIDYGDTPHQFIRYELKSRLVVPETFWVGIQQVDSKSVGVGYDLTYDNDALTFYDSLGNWVNPRFGGTLMIRPEMVNPLTVAASTEPTLAFLEKIEIYPNPGSGEEIFVEVGEHLRGQFYQLQLINVQGQRVWQSDHLRLETSVQSFRLDRELPRGIYFVRHMIGEDSMKTFSDKLMIR